MSAAINGGSARGVVTLRPARGDDWRLIRRWVARADVSVLLGPPSAAEAAITLAMSDPQGHCRVIEHDGRPAGYAQAVDVGLWNEPLPREIAPGMYDVELMVGEPELRGIGIGQRALDLLAEEVFSTTLALALSVIMPVRHEAAVRAYEKAGFRWRGIWRDPISGMCWVLIRDRPVRATGRRDRA